MAKRRQTTIYFPDLRSVAPTWLFSLLVPDSELSVVFSNSVRLRPTRATRSTLRQAGFPQRFHSTVSGKYMAGGGQRWVLPNMLATFFGRPEEQHSYYREDVWVYLSSVPLERGHTSDQKTTAASGLMEGSSSSRCFEFSAVQAKNCITHEHQCGRQNAHH